MGLVEYKPGTTFPGVIGKTVDQSSPAWPEPLRAREGAPNVLFIVLDDTGFPPVRRSTGAQQQKQQDAIRRVQQQIGKMRPRRPAAEQLRIQQIGQPG